jgi:hemerythrin-like domain-containing protein
MRQDLAGWDGNSGGNLIGGRRIMRSLEELRGEHRVIEMVLNGLEKLASQVTKGKPLDCEKAEKALEMLRNFADRCHHGKEEKHLFKIMEARGVTREGGPLGVMLQEHEEGRAYIREMGESARPAAKRDKGTALDFAQHAKSYIELLRQHILKEDEILYPMAEHLLSAEDDKQLMKAFEVVEKKEMGAGVHEKYHKWAKELADSSKK